MCNCRADIEAKLLNRHKENTPDARLHTAELKGYGFILADAGMREVGQMPIELTSEGQLKKGGFKLKKERMTMFFTFCPFCGEKYKKD